MERIPILGTVAVVTTSQSQCKFLKRLFLLGLLVCCISLLFHYLSNTQYLIFSQQYPINVCSAAKKDKCNRGSGSDIYSWPVHGIWPTYTRGSYPQFCQKISFDLDALQSILPDLKERWYSIFGDNVKFWKHEWSKHGTCATNETPLNNELNYFKKGLEWNREYPIKDILARQNITPRDDSAYSVYDIHQAFKSELGVRVGIVCVKKKITEVRMCFSMDLNLINCNESKDDGCDVSEVYYPKNATKFFGV